MIPAWSRSNDGKWHPCWLISTSPHGSGERHVLIAFDDTPRLNSGYPAGSISVRSVVIEAVRIRRDVIPLNDGDA